MIYVDREVVHITIGRGYILIGRDTYHNGEGIHFNRKAIHIDRELYKLVGKKKYQWEDMWEGILIGREGLTF